MVQKTFRCKLCSEIVIGVSMFPHRWSVHRGVMQKVNVGHVRSEKEKEFNRVAHLGRVQSEEVQRKKIETWHKNNDGKPHPSKGYKHSEEWKRETSGRMKVLMADPEYRSKVLLGLAKASRNKSPELCRAISEGTKLSYVRDPSLRDQRRAYRMTLKLPVKDTLPERIVQDALRSANLKFSTNYPLGITLADIAFPEKRLAIFLDGDWWHKCPEHFPAKSQEAVNKVVKDSLISETLRRRGWTVLRFWECEVKGSPREVFGVIFECLGELSCTV